MANTKSDPSSTPRTQVPQSIIQSIVKLSKIPSPILYLGYDENGISVFHRWIEEDIDRFYAEVTYREVKYREARPPDIRQIVSRVAGLAKPARKLLQEIDRLSADEKDFIKRHFNWEVPLAPKPDDAAKFFADFRNGIAMLSMLEYFRQKIVPKSVGGAPFKADFSDRYGPFYNFAGELVFAIESRGGRATVDKNSGTGTLIEVLEKLQPYMPDECVPPHLFAKYGNRRGVCRLAEVKSKTSIRRELPRFISQFSTSSSQPRSETKTG